MTDCFGPSSPKYLRTYMEEIYKLGYSDKPPYSKLRIIFQNQLHGRDPTKTLEWVASSKSQKVKVRKVGFTVGPRLSEPLIVRTLDYPDCQNNEIHSILGVH